MKRQPNNGMQAPAGAGDRPEQGALGLARRA
jgi:hypothetical protein